MKYAALRWALPGVLAICAGSCTSAGNGEDMSTTGPHHPDLAVATCFTGTPKTQADLLNQCTDAEQVDRPTLVPTTLWDGTAPLTPLP